MASLPLKTTTFGTQVKSHECWYHFHAPTGCHHTPRACKYSHRRTGLAAARPVYNADAGRCIAGSNYERSVEAASASIWAWAAQPMGLVDITPLQRAEGVEVVDGDASEASGTAAQRAPAAAAGAGLVQIMGLAGNNWYDRRGPSPGKEKAMAGSWWRDADAGPSAPASVFDPGDMPIPVLVPASASASPAPVLSAAAVDVALAPTPAPSAPDADADAAATTAHADALYQALHHFLAEEFERQGLERRLAHASTPASASAPASSGPSAFSSTSSTSSTSSSSSSDAPLPLPHPSPPTPTIHSKPPIHHPRPLPLLPPPRHSPASRLSAIATVSPRPHTPSLITATPRRTSRHQRIFEQIEAEKRRAAIVACGAGGAGLAGLMDGSTADTDTDGPGDAIQPPIERPMPIARPIHSIERPTRQPRGPPVPQTPNLRDVLNREVWGAIYGGVGA